MANFVSNDDALEVLDKYAKGIKKGIGVVAVRETSPAAAAHAVGDYIRYSGTVYKVKSAISIGDSLILNTNIEANDLPDDTTIYTPGLDEENFSEEISSIVNVYGGKNLLRNNATTRTTNDITFTVNDDGSVTVNGTASADAVFRVKTDYFKPDDKTTYILNGCPNGGSLTSYQMHLYYRNSSSTSVGSKIITDSTQEIVCKKSDFANTKYFDVLLIVASGTTVNNLTFKPMIRDARIKDPTYAPYAMTNRELTKYAEFGTVHTAAANQTFKQQMAELYSYLTKITGERLYKTAIITDGIMYKISDVTRYVYGAVTCNSSELYCRSMRFYSNGNHKIFDGLIDGNGITLTDKSDNTNSAKMNLVII